MIGTVFDIKEFGVHDGPGLRTTVFLKGCPLRCMWCHNPEGLSAGRQLMVRRNGCLQCGLCRRPCSHEDCRPFGRCLHICPQNLVTVCGEEMTPEALAGRLLRNRQLLTGITFSGGEPLLQADFLLETAKLLEGLPLAAETSGYADGETFLRVIDRMDLVYMDLKLANDDLHRRYTGVSNVPILDNLERLRRSGKKCVVRTPLIPGITDTKENLEAIRRLVGELPWEQLPYNALAGAKYALLGMEYPYELNIHSHQ